MAKTKTATIEAEPEPFRMPEVEVGDIVLWRQGLDSAPTPAIVTALGHSAVNLSVFNPSYANMYTVDGVKHVDDPAASIDLQEELGNWDYTPRDKRLREQLAFLMELVSVKPTV